MTMKYNPPFDKNIEFKEIPGFPNYYAGSDGEIYSRNYKKNHIPKEYRKLKPGRQRLNYKVYNLKVNGKCIMQRGHVLICIAYHGKRPDKMQCSHLDDDKENNKPQNLKWETDSENKRRKFVNNGGDKGIKNSRSIFNKEDVIYIRELIMQEKTNKQIAQIFNCSPTSISRVRSRKRYSEVA